MTENKKQKIVDGILIFVMIMTCVVCVLLLLGDKAWILYYGFIDFLKQSWIFIVSLVLGGK